MTLLTILIAAFLTGFSGAMVPGPLLTVTISETFKRGFIAGPLVVIGHSLLEGAMVVGLMFGLGQLLHNQVFGRVLSVVGGAVLLWMGYGIIKDAFKGKISLDFKEIEKTPSQKTSLLFPVASGIVTSIANPYWTLWWITFGASFLQKSLQFGTIGVSFFYFGHIMADFVWYSSVAFVLTSGRNFLSSRVYCSLLGVAGLFLTVLALTFIFMGFTEVKWFQ
jgi:threonine/homoserine/homoserine lactone efflux protein